MVEREELQKWVRTFPSEFYVEMYRLWGWKWPGGKPSNRRTHAAARLTNNLIYDRLAPGVRKKLDEKSPKDKKGRRKNKLFQWLSDDYGLPALREHLAKVVTLEQVSEGKEEFMDHMDRLLPKFVDTPLFGEES